jgi:hypothetical protein
MASIQSWKNRYTVREFDTTKIPTTEQIKHITDCLNYMPVQVTEDNPRLPNHFVFMLTPEDTEIKKLLVQKVFYITNPDEHFTALYDAPYVFLLVDILRHYTTPNQISSVADTPVFLVGVGVTTGIILTQALESGLDVCQIACTSNFEDSDPRSLEIINLLKKRFAEEIKTLTTVHKEYKIDIGSIALGIGVGFGKPTTQNTTDIHKKTGLPFDATKKLTKKQPFMYVDNV